MNRERAEETRETHNAVRAEDDSWRALMAAAEDKNSVDAVIHACLIREGTCVESPCCDYCICGDKNPIAQEYEIAKKENGLLVSVRR